MKYLSLLLVLLTLQVSAKERVVSIGGDVTQIIYALGAQEQLVGRDSTSEQPVAAQEITNIGYMRQLNTEGILALKPTLVLVSELAKPSIVLQQLRAVGVKVVQVTGQNHLSAIVEKINTIASALQCKHEAQPLIAQINQKISALPEKPLQVKALYIMAHSGASSLVAGHSTAADEAMRSAGLINVMKGVPHYQPMSQEGVISGAPDLVITSREAIKVLGGEENIWQLPGLALTPAGKQHQLFLTDQMALLGFGLGTPDAILALRRAAEKIAHD